MVLFEAGKLPPGKFMNLWQLDDLRGIQMRPGESTLGALTTYTAVREHAGLRREFPLLVQAARETGAIAIQNRGTLGGNIVNASPAADSPPALLVYEAELELISAAGERLLPYREFHLGYKKTALRPDELLRAIRLPRLRSKAHAYYRKVGTRQAQAISKVCLAGLAWLGKDGFVTDIRLALGSVAPVPMRCVLTETALRGQRLTPDLIREAQAVLQTEIAPIDDIRSLADYRRRVAQGCLRQFLEGMLR
jgi:CO/xanthine dehydrogenase FAD-binding subunit